MQRFAVFAAMAGMIMLVSGAMPDQVAAAQRGDAAATDISAQSRTVRARPRIRVYPRYYPRRNYHALYPLPYAVEYPGPKAVRQCASRLVPEYRPSRTVVVPRMRCWWTRL